MCTSFSFNYLLIPLVITYEVSRVYDWYFNCWECYFTCRWMGTNGGSNSDAAGSAEKYDMIQKHLLETANTTYRPLKEAQQVYLDVGTALEATGDSTERALRITDSLSFSYTHNATAADKAASATNAL